MSDRHDRIQNDMHVLIEESKALARLRRVLDTHRREFYPRTARRSNRPETDEEVIERLAAK